MKLLQQRLKLGWRVLSDVHTALWLLGIIAAIPAAVVAWGVYIANIPWPLIAAIVVIAYALVALILVATIGVAVEHTAATRGSPVVSSAVLPSTAGNLGISAITASTTTSVNYDSDWEFIDGVDPNYLWGYFKDRMSVEAQRSIEPYLGQPVTIRGRLEDVHPGKKLEYAIAYLFQNLERRLIFVFDEKEAQKISVVPRGTLLDIAGQIENVRAGECRIDKCRFSVLR